MDDLKIFKNDFLSTMRTIVDILCEN